MKFLLFGCLPPAKCGECQFATKLKSQGMDSCSGCLEKLLLPCEGSSQVCGCLFHGHRGKPAELVPACNVHAPLQWGKLARTIPLGAVSGFDWGEKVKNVDCYKFKNPESSYSDVFKMLYGVVSTSAVLNSNSRKMFCYQKKKP